MAVDKGQTFTPDRDGYFLSDFALGEIENARVQEKKKLT